MLYNELKERILILDGAMGTVLQKYKFSENDFLGKSKTCFDILNETRPDVIQEIHEKYIEAGADIIETNSFNCNAISLKKYGFEDKVFELAKKSAEIAKKATKITKRKVYIFGSIGPTNKSLSPIIGKFSYEKNYHFINMKKTYKEQIQGLINGGVDALLIETIFDELNARAAVLAAEEVFKEQKINLPLCLSATVDKNGNLSTGESIESLILNLDRPAILSFGLNCSFGAKNLVPLAEKIHRITDKFISLHPNAGLPDKNGNYLETPEKMENYLYELIKEKKINILGGCCGTTYEHIKILASLAKTKNF